jgi:hypothetical protein
MICAPHPKLFGLRKIKNDQRGGECDTCRIQERCVQGFGKGEA